MAVTISQCPVSDHGTAGDRWGVTKSYNDRWYNFVQVTNTESYTIYVTSIKIYMAVLANGNQCALPGDTSYYGDGKPISLTFTASSKSSTPETISNTVGSTRYTQSQTTSEGTLTKVGYKPNAITTQHTFTFSNPVPVESNTTVKFVYSATSPSGSSLSDSVTCWEYSSSYALSCTWNQGQYVVVFNGNGQTGGSTSNQTFVIGTAQNLTANGFTKTGHSFAGWATSSTGSVVYEDKASVNNLASAGATFNLYAKWTANNYTVTYKPNGPTADDVTQSVTYGSTWKTKAAQFTRDGYTQDGWATSSTGSSTYSLNADQTAYNTADNITLYAHWAGKSYSITYDGNGNTGGSTSATTATYPTARKVASNGFTKTGYSFSKWNTKSDGTGTDYAVGASYSSASNLTLYAIWSINSYTLSYDANGGSSTPDPVTKNYNTTVALSDAISRTASTNATYTVTYDANGYGSTPSANTTYNKTYYTFSKWAAGSTSGTEYSAKASYTITSDIKMYAKWSSSTSTTAITLPSISDSNNQHFFAGWYDKASGGNKIGDAGASYTPTKNITLYAHWTDNNITVQYNANGGSGTINSVTKLYNETITLDSGANFTRSGYKLIGWNTAADDSGTKYKLGKTGYAVTQAVTMYAVWYQNFSWTSNDSTNVTANKPISNATASQWNKLQDNIKKYVDSSYTKTTKSAGDKVVASEVKAVAQKLAVSTAEQNKIVQNQVIPASVFNALTTQINSKAEYLGAS